MARIPKDKKSLTEVIDQAVVDQSSLFPRATLGGSGLGRECDRRIWYSFRWALTENTYEGRVLRLLSRSEREKAWLAELLGIAGCTVQIVDGSGKGFEFFAPDLGGHLRVPIDGIVNGLPEAPKTWHLLKFAVLSDEAFQDLCQNGHKKTFRQEYDEILISLELASLDRALVLAVNRADDTLYSERINADKKAATELLGRAHRVITYQEAPPKISENADKAKCTYCDFFQLCHGAALPSVTCRTCAHSTPVTGAGTEAAWHCKRWDLVVPLSESRQAQPCHVYIPSLISWAEPIDADETAEGVVAVQYQIRGEGESGRTFWNGEGIRDGIKAYSSAELRAVNLAHIGDPQLEAIRVGFDGVVVGVDADTADDIAGVETGAIAGIDDDYSDDIPF
jgi:hypothetical protein